MIVPSLGHRVLLRALQRSAVQAQSRRQCTRPLPLPAAPQPPRHVWGRGQQGLPEALGREGDKATRRGEPENTIPHDAQKCTTAHGVALERCPAPRRPDDVCCLAQRSHRIAPQCITSALPQILLCIPWERHAPAWLLEPGWSPALPEIAHALLWRCTRHRFCSGGV